MLAAKIPLALSLSSSSGEVMHNVWQGDRANGMYFVEAGTLVVLKQIEGDEKKVRRRKYFLIY